ncbi:MAG: hypothetical protein HY273_16170 [Gammaproteobacteria bacterium]|nr:hypothetical protein [Gammaproteobacteria bacterium]
MNTMCNFYRWAPVAILLALTACSDGGTSGTGAKDTHTTQGRITGFGSVFVNGVEYESKASTITLDGVVQSEDKLAVGMVVKVNGSVNADGKTGVATTIDYADELEGIVLAIDTVAKTVNVMGQTVHVTAETLFAGPAGFSLPTMQINNVIEVSGFSSGHGEIHATRIELKKDVFTNEEVELKGVVADLNSDVKTFKVGALVIDYSLASVDAPNGLSNDLYVEIKSTYAPVNNVLSANKIEIKDGGRKGVVGNDGDTLELEGIVTKVNSPAMFELNGQIILLTNQTQYENGDINKLVVGATLEVDAQSDSNGNATANKIKFREASAASLSAYVLAIDKTASTVSVLGLTVQVNNFTVLKDERDNDPVWDFGINKLALEDYVEMKIYKDGSGGWIATQMIRNDAESPGIVSLKGAVENIPALGQLTVAGVTVLIPSGDSQGYNIDDKVKITGTFGSNLLSASAIELGD